VIALWLIIMIAGLGTLGFVFYKVWTAPSTGVDRRWLAAALVGTAVSVMGLVMTLRTVQKEPTVGKAPQATLGGNVQELGTAPTPPPQNQLVPPSAIPASNTLNSKMDAGIPKFDPKQFPEEPGGPTFTAEDYKYFEAETTRLMNKMEEQVTIDMANKGKEAPAAQANRWNLFRMDYELWLGNLRIRSETKKGVGTGQVRQIIYSITSDLDKMERVYHNAAVFPNEKLDVSYIADLREHVEKLTKELQKYGGMPQ
jgi:hypothetical protein